MIDWARFALIVFLTAADYLLRELILSLSTAWDFITHRGRWIVQEKLRLMLRRRW